MTPTLFVIDQIRIARQYTTGLLDHTEPALWMQIPPGCPTHIAWQVGHLTIAQFRLAIHYIRETTDVDDAVLSIDFMTPFRRGTPANHPDAAYPDVADIRAAFDRVNQYVMSELPRYVDVDLDAPARLPHPIAKTKMDILAWIVRHEMIHAGQIGLIRRLLGLEPRW